MKLEKYCVCINSVLENNISPMTLVWIGTWAQREDNIRFE
jgi:hypothetical protein